MTDMTPRLHQETNEKQQQLQKQTNKQTNKPSFNNTNILLRAVQKLDFYFVKLNL